MGEPIDRLYIALKEHFPGKDDLEINNIFEKIKGLIAYYVFSSRIPIPEMLPKTYSRQIKNIMIQQIQFELSH